MLTALLQPNAIPSVAAASATSAFAMARLSRSAATIIASSPQRAIATTASFTDTHCAAANHPVHQSDAGTARKRIKKKIKRNIRVTAKTLATHMNHMTYTMPYPY